MNIVKENYYANIYDVEFLTNLNKERETSPELVSRVEEMVKANQCDKAIFKLREMIIRYPKYYQFFILQGALWTKDKEFKDLIDISEVRRLSPKECALHELLRYLNKPKPIIEDLMVTEKPVRIAWDAINPNPRDKNEIINFYKSTDSYIYELMASNNVAQTLYSYSVLANKLKDLNVNTILDYGAGAGTLSIILKQIGYNIIYADLTGKTFEFAKWRFKQRNIEIPMINLSENLDLAKLNFDCILCTEVIEHLVDPIKLLNKFNRLLKKNGILVVSESCEYVEEFSSHLESNRKYGGENFIKILKDLQFNHIFKEPFIPQLIFIRE